MKRLLFALALAACNQSAVPTGDGGAVDAGGVDALAGSGDLAGPIADLAVAGDLAMGGADLGGFCAGGARIQLNGMLAQTPAVTSKPVILNCCDAAEVEYVSMQIATTIAVVWRHQVGQGPNPPVTIDVANPPAGWSVSVMSGCGPADGNCTPSDVFASGQAGFSGTVVVEGGAQSYKTTVCVHADDGASPHAVIHRLDAWTPPVATQ